MRRRLSDDALSTLAEIEAECRDGEPWTDADQRAYEAFVEAHAHAHAHDNDTGDTLSAGDWWAAEQYIAGATHDAAGFPLTSEFPF